LVFVFVCIGPRPVQAQFPKVGKVAAQPLLVQIKRLREAMDYLGNPLSDKTKAALDQAAKEKDSAKVTQLIEAALDPYCLMGVVINPESRVKVVTGPAKPILNEQGWSQFLIKVVNQAGVTAKLNATSPNALPVHTARHPGQRAKTAPADKVRDRWLDMKLFEGRPLNPRLSGLKLEYRIVQLYSRDAGKRAAVIAFDVGQGSQDIGFRNDVTITFDCKASIPVTLGVMDENNKPTMAAFVIRDQWGRVYPSQAKRLAPDFAFHPQVYRADGEKINLPAGTYTFDVTRGPEYLAQKRTVKVADKPLTEKFKLQRWIDPSTTGWWSGDHHIHAAGCSHYSDPTLGVLASDMYRHCLGEDLKVGANLTWGPGFDFQKQFFTGKIDKISKYPYLLRYDVEVSGFGSHRSGHLCLLRLKQQIPPGGESTDHWPTLCLNTLRWAKKQGAVVGPAHSGWGLKVPGTQLPNYNIPPFDSIGANEYIVDVTHKVPGPDGRLVPAVDFLSTIDTPYVWELNIWYQTLNCGFRTRVSGETDFPCIYGERVGLGRSYVKLDGKLNYDDWCEGVRKGRAYVSDGYSHLLDFRVSDVPMGVGESELQLGTPEQVQITAKVASMLSVKPNAEIRKTPYWRKPFWHPERARIGDTRKVKVEVVVNGYPVAHQEIEADGKMNDVSFNIPIKYSSWVALRILPSAHTNPIFVLVDGKPIRPSRRSAQWCLESVDQCWSQKKGFIAEKEMAQAKKDYDHARQVYKKILAQSVAE